MATPVSPAPAPYPSPSATPPAERHTAPGGVMYVGPSLTRSLLGVAVALSRGRA
jgi:hypothetical protein